MRSMLRSMLLLVGCRIGAILKLANLGFLMGFVLVHLAALIGVLVVRDEESEIMDR